MTRVESAIKLGKEILSLIPDIPEEGQNFAYSVEEKTTNIVDWIEQHNVVTERQEIALENILSGIEKWLH